MRVLGVGSIFRCAGSEFYRVYSSVQGRGAPAWQLAGSYRLLVTGTGAKFVLGAARSTGGEHLGERTMLKKKQLVPGLAITLGLASAEHGGDVQQQRAAEHQYEPQFDHSNLLEGWSGRQRQGGCGRGRRRPR